MTSISSSLSIMLGFILISSIVILPIFIIKNSVNLQSPTFKQKYSSIYNSVNTNSKLKSLQSSIFLFHRFLLTCTIVFLKPYPIFQCMSLVYLSLIKLIYTTSVKPFALSILNKIETANEVIILLNSVYFLVCLTVVDASP